MWIRRLSCLLLLAVVLVAGCDRSQPDPVDHDTALRRLAAQLGADRTDAAVRDLRTYLESAPADASMRYNLACLVARGGDLDSALLELRRALTDGYRRLDQMRADQDLSGLHADPRFISLLDDHLADLREAAFARALGLTGNDWSEPMALDEETTVRLRFGTAALEVELSDPDAVLAGWLVVAVPDDPEAHEGRRWFEFELRRDQGELTAHTPPVNVDNGVVRVPWEALAPHRPPLDLLLGFNLALDTTAGRVALVDDPHLGRPDAPWRRFTTVTVDPGDEPRPLLTARPDTRLAIGDTLSMEVAVQGLIDGPVPVSLATSDGARVEIEMFVDFGLGFDTALLAVENAAPGWVELTATAPDADLTWHGRVFRLTADWFLDRRAEVAAITGPEQDIVRFWLFRVLRGQQNFDPRDDPTALAEAVAFTDNLLTRHAETGSMLPAAATVMPAAIGTGGDALVEARLILPAASQRDDALLSRVVLVEDTVQMQTLADGMDPAAPGHFAWLVLPVPPVPGSDAATVAQVQIARRWLASLMPGANRPELVGIGRAANSALLAAASDPGQWSSLRLWADHTLDPWPLAADEELPSMVSDELKALVEQLRLVDGSGRHAAAVVEALGKTPAEADQADDLAAWLAR